jgi:hypothetical protein
MIKRIVVLILIPIVVFLLLIAWGQINATAPGRRFALIVNTWNDFPNENATDVGAMPAQALQAYFALKNRGFSDEDIYLMLYHPNQSFIDVEGNGLNDLARAHVDDAEVTKENLRIALDALAGNVTQYDEAIVYVVGHGDNMSGSSSAFSFESGDIVTGNEFGTWLNHYKCKQLTILLDFCFSGNFAKPLEDSGRSIVSAAEDDKESWYYWNWGGQLNTTDKAIYGNSGSAFFHPFWKKFSEGATIEEAFNYGREECIRWGDTDNTNPRARNVVQVQNAQIFSINRTVFENFVYFFPGGQPVWWSAVLILSFYETIIISATLATWVQRHRH